MGLCLASAGNDVQGQQLRVVWTVMEMDPRRRAFEERLRQREADAAAAAAEAGARGGGDGTDGGGGGGDETKEEQIAAFWTEFNAGLARVDDMLERIERDVPEIGQGAEAAERTQALQGVADEVGEMLSGMQTTATEATLFLPDYDTRRTQEELRKSRDSLNVLKKKLQPRKKFAFSNRSSKKKQEQQPQPASTAASAEGGQSGAKREQRRQQRADHMIQERADEAVELSRSDVASDGSASVLVSQLQRCQVRILAPLGFVRLEHLEHCTVTLGPIGGALYLESCTDCVIVAASHQVRAHNSLRNRLHLHVPTSPIIEDCDDMGFGGYTAAYAELEADMVVCHLANTQSNHNDVKDFKWHRQQKSPHWHVLSSHEAAATEEAEAQRQAQLAAFAKELREEEKELAAATSADAGTHRAAIGTGSGGDGDGDDDDDDDDQGFSDWEDDEGSAAAGAVAANEEGGESKGGGAAPILRLLARRDDAAEAAQEDPAGRNWFRSVEEMVVYEREQSGFDLPAVLAELGITSSDDILRAIQVVNCVRTLVRDGQDDPTAIVNRLREEFAAAPVTAAAGTVGEEEEEEEPDLQFLQPVFEGDALLYQLEVLLGEDEDEDEEDEDDDDR